MPDKNNIITWKKVTNTNVKIDDFEGVLIVGPNGVCDPLKRSICKRDTGFLSCAGYHNGDIMLAKNTIVIEDAISVCEKKIAMDIIDVETIGTLTYIIASTGEIIYSETEGDFQISHIKYDKLNSIKKSDNFFLICGSNIIILHDPASPNRNSFINITVSNANFISACKFGECIIGLTEDNRLILFTSYKDIEKSYEADLSEILKGSKINEIYMANNSLFLLGNSGVIAVIINAANTINSGISNIDIYAMRISTVDWTTMVYLGDSLDTYVVAGCGSEEHSYFTTSSFVSFIMDHDMLHTRTELTQYSKLVNRIRNYNDPKSNTYGKVIYDFYRAILPVYGISKKHFVSYYSLLLKYGLTSEQIDNIDTDKMIIMLNPYGKSITDDVTFTTEIVPNDKTIIIEFSDKSCYSDTAGPVYADITLILGGDK